MIARPSSARAPAEQRLLHSASRRIAIQITALFAGAMLLLGVLAAVLVVQDQHSAVDQQLRQAVADTDAATDPPSGILVYQQTAGGHVTASPELHGRPLNTSEFDAVSAGGAATTRQTRVGQSEFLVRTAHRGGTTVQAGMDLAEQAHERDRLTAALAIAGGCGIVIAALVGWFIARRAIAPLGVALARQQRFVADASHELRTPLTQVHTRAQLIARQLHRMPQAGPVSDDADRLVAGTRQLGEIIDDMLMAAQLRVEPAQMQPVDLSALATEAAEAEHDRAATTGVTIAVEPARGSAVVNGVPSALRRVLASLLDNALGHTDAGGTITIGVSGSDAAVQVVVDDTGIGLGGVDPETLFERFTRGSHGSGRRYGIGLALVREVIDAHGGTVRAGVSAAGGAAFTVILPAAEPARADQAPSDGQSDGG